MGERIHKAARTNDLAELQARAMHRAWLNSTRARHLPVSRNLRPTQGRCHKRFYTHDKLQQGCCFGTITSAALCCPVAASAWPHCQQATHQCTTGWAVNPAALRMLQALCRDMRLNGALDAATKRSWLNWTDADGRTSLQWASQRGFVQAAQAVRMCRATAVLPT